MKPYQLTIGLVATLVCMLAGWRVFQNHRIPGPGEPGDQLAETKTQWRPDPTPPPPSSRPEAPSPGQPTPSSTTPPAAPKTPTQPRPRLNAPPQASPQVQPVSPQTNRPDRELRDPLARIALAYVGADPDAEEYWLGAIFDPSLPDEERDDLMEDLNEVGFSDPRHPGPEDLPLILNRIGIIEEVAPYADDFMLPHLWEAYKDLINLLYGEAPQ